jgi:hypothetical protein
MRAFLVALGVAAMIAAALSLTNLTGLGFPDGYITPYDRATLPWVTGTSYALLLAGLFTLAAAAFAKLRRATAGIVIAALLFAGLSLIESCPRLDWCTAGVLQFTGTMIDDGTGG